MDFTMIITVALAAAIIVMWRIGDKNAALARFIRENIELLDEINNHTK